MLDVMQHNRRGARQANKQTDIIILDGMDECMDVCTDDACMRVYG